MVHFDARICTKRNTPMLKIIWSFFHRFFSMFTFIYCWKFTNPYFSLLLSLPIALRNVLQNVCQVLLLAGTHLSLNEIEPTIFQPTASRYILHICSFAVLYSFHSLLFHINFKTWRCKIQQIRPPNAQNNSYFSSESRNFNILHSIW